MPTDPGQLAALAALVLAAAVLYSTVGHAGASAYLVAMALFGVAPAAMKPAALTMNIVVATAGTLRFAANAKRPQVARRAARKLIGDRQPRKLVRWPRL